MPVYEHIPIAKSFCEKKEWSKNAIHTYRIYGTLKIE